VLAPGGMELKLKILITSIVDLKKSHIKLLEKAGPKMLQKPQESLHKTSSASAGQQTASIAEKVTVTTDMLLVMLDYCLQHKRATLG